MKKLLGLAVILTVAGSLYAGEVKDITIPELKEAIAKKKVVLLDANGTKSWQKGHIAGAIDFKGKEAKLEHLLPKDKGALVVAYCGGPRCMAYKAAVAAAEKIGYTNIKHLPAGIHGWIDAGEPTEAGH
jgi:rhodanese-related sulfurtransferase